MAKDPILQTPEVRVTVHSGEKKPEDNAQPVKAGDLVEDASGRLVDPAIADARQIIPDGGDNTPMAPRPREQTDPGAEDPMKRQAAEAPGSTLESGRGDKQYVLARDFYDQRVLHRKGEVMSFPEGSQPRGARPVEGRTSRR